MAANKQFIAKNGLNNNNNIIINVSDPIANTDAANKRYADTKLPNTKDISSVSLTSSSLTITKADATFVNTTIPTWNQSTTGNAATATKLSSAKTISTTGDATWSVSFDGVNNVSSTLTLSNTGVTSGTYTKVTVNTKGLITAAENLTAADIPNLNVSKIIGLGNAAGKNVNEPYGVPTLDGYGKIQSENLPINTLRRLAMIF